MSNKPAVAGVRKAVIPVAGLGTRFLPVTRVVPKALLPVINKPLIHYAVQEAAAAGIRDIALVLSPGMGSVASYFAHQAMLETALRERGQPELLRQQQQVADLAHVEALYQREPRGLGHAVLLARDFIANEPFAVFLPDDIIFGEPSAIAQLLAVRERKGGSVIAARTVPIEQVPRYGIIDGQPAGPRVFTVRRLVEKPKPEQAPGNLAIVGRYVLEPGVFNHLEKTKPGAGGEIQITDAIAALIGESPLHACVLTGAHMDAGVPAGLFAASIHEAQKDPALRHAVLEAVKSWRKDGATPRSGP